MSRLAIGIAVALLSLGLAGCSGGAAPQPLPPIMLCPLAPLVILIFGQSNAGNSGDEIYKAGESVTAFNWRDGKCYRAFDPQPGTDGPGGSMWGRVGDALAAEIGRPVLIVSFAQPGTSALMWTTGDLAARIDTVAAALKTAGYRADFVTWQQGEAEAASGVDAAAYEAQLRQIAAHSLQAFGTTMIAAKSSTIKGGAHGDIVRAVVDKLWQDGTFIPGPDFDLDVNASGDRNNGTHLTAQGTAKGAALWADTIRALVD